MYLEVFKGLSIYYVIMDRRERGGVPDLLQYYIGEGGGCCLGTPNLYDVIYGQPLGGWFEVIWQKDCQHCYYE